MAQLLWLIPALPFAGFAINGLLGARVLPRRAAGPIACAAVLGSLLLAIAAVAEAGRGSLAQDLFAWMPMGRGPGGADLTVRFAFLLDPLAGVMVLVVTGVGLLIHVYSIGYMASETRAGQARFFAYLNLFTGMMLTLVLGATLPVLFVGWEGVGLSSYLLIGFWYDRMFDERTGMTCADAGRKAFLTTRVGDTGFLLGMLLLFASAGTLDIRGILAQAPALGPGVCTAAGLLLFLGACGKSAQIPLYVWLPDAMAGPTPVSALIHAATMVTAGVYLACRMAPLYLAAPVAMHVIAVVGAATALYAAVIGLAQDDIKKVLAYSTISQIGYMMLAAGVGAFTAAIFHLMTHAFFKGLLFLGAGSVIHALSGEQDLRRMGGLRRALPWTHATFAVAVLAIAGIPPFAGFFSKDEILWAALSGRGGSPLLWGAGVLTAALTALYMTRLYLLVFGGESRAGAEARRHLHESPAVMTVPLVALAAGSAVAGFLGLPAFLRGGRPGLLEEYLSAVLPSGAAGPEAPLTEWGALAVALVAAVTGIAAAAALYGKGPLRPRSASGPSTWTRLVKGKFFVDEAIEAAFLRPFRALCRAAAEFDTRVIDRIVNGAGVSADLASQVARLAQTGYVRNYAFTFLLGVVVILYFALR
jgi:NADH-quinone oxidoreductase subunit L